jgi:hypothetical protein
MSPTKLSLAWNNYIIPGQMSPIKLSLARESMVGDIPDGTGKSLPFFTVYCPFYVKLMEI